MRTERSGGGNTNQGPGLGAGLAHEERVLKRQGSAGVGRDQEENLKDRREVGFKSLEAT